MFELMMMVDWDVKAKKADGDERRVEATNASPRQERAEAATARQVEQGGRAGGPVKQEEPEPG